LGASSLRRAWGGMVQGPGIALMSRVNPPSRIFLRPHENDAEEAVERMIV